MIRVQNLVFTYPHGSAPAVKGVSFGVEPGEVFGFLGPSGAGKSTTQKVLIGLLKEYQGQIQVFDRDLKTWGSAYYERIGVSFELPNHYQKLTALENLKLFRSLYSVPTDEPAELLDLVGLGDDGNTPVSAFSKGMQMRLNFVRALLHRPELLFLDEPTAGLDPGNARLIRDIVRDLQQQGRTIFLTTHDMTVADALCDRVGFMVEGEIVVIDTPRALKLRHGTQTVRVEYRRNGGSERADYPLKDIGRNADFLEVMRTQEIETIHTQEATLEEIFIQVTGRSLA